MAISFACVYLRLVAALAAHRPAIAEPCCAALTAGIHLLLHVLAWRLDAA